MHRYVIADLTAHLRQTVFTNCTLGVKYLCKTGYRIQTSLLALCGDRLFSPPNQELRYLARYSARDVTALAGYCSQDHTSLDILHTNCPDYVQNRSHKTS